MKRAKAMRENVPLGNVLGSEGRERKEEKKPDCESLLDVSIV